MYITIEELKKLAEGYTDDEYLTAIKAAQDEIEFFTGNRFLPSQVIFSFPSVKGERISLPFPLWKLEEVKINNMPYPVLLFNLNPYSSPPYIEVYRPLDGDSLFVKGIGGSFKPGPNFPDDLEDFEVFPMVKYCALILAITKLGNPFNNSFLLETAVRAEETDGHRIEYFADASSIKNPKLFLSKTLSPFKASIGGLSL